jgi:hypothetical protein
MTINSDLAMPKPGDLVRYRAQAGDEWDAVLTGVRAFSIGIVVDLEIKAGLGEDVHLRNIPWMVKVSGRGKAYPKESK